MDHDMPYDDLGIRPVKRAYQQVADELRRLIITGDLGIGDKLPTEAELAERFKTSRSTIREALRLLSSQSVIETRPGAKGGSTVARPELSDASDFLTTMLTLLAGTSDLSVADILEGRILLEEPATRLAVERNRSKLVASLEKITAEHGLHDSDGDLFADHIAFHNAIVLASGNAVLYLMAGPISQVIRRRFFRRASDRGFWSAVSNEHTRILEAIRTGSPDEAAEQMRIHLQNLGRIYRRIDQADASASADQGGASDGRRIASVETNGKERDGL